MRFALSNFGKRGLHLGENHSLVGGCSFSPPIWKICAFVKLDHATPSKGEYTKNVWVATTYRKYCWLMKQPIFWDENKEKKFELPPPRTHLEGHISFGFTKKSKHFFQGKKKNVLNPRLQGNDQGKVQNGGLRMHARYWNIIDLKTFLWIMPKPLILFKAFLIVTKTSCILLLINPDYLKFEHKKTAGLRFKTFGSLPVPALWA